MPTASTVAAIAQGRACDPATAMEAPASSGAPRNVAMKTGFTIAMFICCMACTKVRSSTLARPGITPVAQVK